MLFQVVKHTLSEPVNHPIFHFILGVFKQGTYIILVKQNHRKLLSATEHEKLLFQSHTTVYLIE